MQFTRCLFGIYKDLHKNIRNYFYTEVTFKKILLGYLDYASPLASVFGIRPCDTNRFTLRSLYIGQHSTDIRVTPGMSERV